MRAFLNLIIWFSVMSVFMFFAGVLMYQIGDEFVIKEVNDVANNVSGTLGISTEMQTSINKARTDYSNLDFQYDLFFLISFCMTFILSVVAAYKSRESSWFTFFGTITLGFMMILFFISIINTVNDWLILNLIENFLEFELATTPIFYYYVSNIGMVNFVWMVVLVLINKLNLSEVRASGDDEDINIIGGRIER